MGRKRLLQTLPIHASLPTSLAFNPLPITLTLSPMIQASGATQDLPDLQNFPDIHTLSSAAFTSVDHLLFITWPLLFKRAHLLSFIPKEKALKTSYR